ncbi:hypothetical protein E2562_039021 [Oryza meyeriana var. granulata]|uniref:Uncharacterized protein n=1 Tax=Oryza meyeriana var. granulata TaxID=110450 RepID=A0A6G1DT58_9ORYZ|nr:hypothetical protein E2562_039021 [Oryza meyeriana var. granulata]
MDTGMYLGARLERPPAERGGLVLDPGDTEHRASSFSKPNLLNRPRMQAQRIIITKTEGNAIQGETGNGMAHLRSLHAC